MQQVGPVPTKTVEDPGEVLVEMKNFRDTRAKAFSSNEPPISKVYKAKPTLEEKEKRTQETLDLMRLKAQSIQAKNVKKKKERQAVRLGEKYEQFSRQY